MLVPEPDSFRAVAYPQLGRLAFAGEATCKVLLPSHEFVRGDWRREGCATRRAGTVTY